MPLFAWWGVVARLKEHAAAELAFVYAANQATNASPRVVGYGCSRLGEGSTAE